MIVEGLELISFQIISSVGTAKSMYIEALQAAKEGNFIQADNMIKQADEVFTEGHKAHAGLIQQEANGQNIEFKLLLMHAEDQLMATDTIAILIKEMIEMYKNK